MRDGGIYTSPALTSEESRIDGLTPPAGGDSWSILLPPNQQKSYVNRQFNLRIRTLTRQNLFAEYRTLSRTRVKVSKLHFNTCTDHLTII